MKTLPSDDVQPQAKHMVYHGSPTPGLKTIEPRASRVLDGEKAVFGTPNEDVAISFLVPWTDDNFQQGSHNGQLYMREMAPGNFESFFKGKEGYIYGMDSAAFKSDDRLTRFEMIAKDPQPVVQVRHITDALEALKQTKFTLYTHDQVLPWDEANIKKAMSSSSKTGTAMNKREYLIAALQSGAYRRTEWILSAFTVVRHDPNKVPAPYPYQIVRGEHGDHKLYCLDPTHDMQPVEIESSHAGEPLFAFTDRITLQPGDLSNVKAEIETRVGNVLFNCIVVIYAFNDKMPFVTGRVKPDKLEHEISRKLRDTPESEEERVNDPNILYVDEYIRFCEGMSSLAGLTQISSPAASEKSMTVDPAIIKRRDELLIEYKDQLHDPAIISRIEQELVAMDRASLKDDPAADFYIKAKSYDVSRKRAYIMFGIETGFGDNSRGVNLVRPSLREGVDMNNMPGWVDSVRAGSYGRGKETALGGESVKYFYRIFQNTRVAEPDCGTPQGLMWQVNEDNYANFVGLHLAGKVKADPDTTRLTEAFLKTQFGKELHIRSPMLCKTDAPSFCARCVGDGFAANPTGLHIAISDVGSNFMYAFMQAVHGKALKTARYRFKHSIT